VVAVGLGLVVLAATIGCKKKGPPPQFVPESGMTAAGEFEDPEKAFSVSIPQGWSEQDAGLPGMVLLLQPDGDQDGVNINVIKEWCGTQQMLEEYCRMNDRNMVRDTPDFNPLGERLLGAVAGAPASILEFTFTNNERTYEAKQYTFIIIPNAYQVTLSAPEGTLEQYEDALNLVLNSWESAQEWEEAMRQPASGKPEKKGGADDKPAPKPEEQE
jgi:hypothetical protein